MPLFDHFKWIAPYYDRLASAPDLDFWRRALRLPADGRLLDAGGGTGRVSHPLAGEVEQVVLVDETARMLVEAYQKPPLAPLLAQIERLPFGDASFSRVMMVDALHHVREQRRCAQELLRVLQPGGRLAVLEPDLGRNSGKFVAVVEKLLLMRTHLLTARQLSDLFTNPGVRVEVHQVREQVLLLVDRL